MSKRSKLVETLLQILKDGKPESVEDLVNQAAEILSIPEKEIADCVLTLQSQGKIRLKEQPATFPAGTSTHIRSKEAYWFWATITLLMLTAIFVSTIPENTYPLAYIRHVLGAVFVLWLPGYVFTRAFFPSSRTNPSSNIESTERAALSIGMSLALVPLVGLLIHYSPWGLDVTTIVSSLTVLTLVFAIVALLREARAIRNMSKRI